MPPAGSEPQPPPAKSRKRVLLIVVGVVVAVVVLAVLAVGLRSLFPSPSTGNDGDTNPPPEKSWMEVIRLSGSTDKTTDSFFIGGERFRVNWSATADNEFGLFSIYVYKPGQSLWLETVFVSWDVAETKSDSTVVFDSGEVYLDIGAANLADYEIIIEEYTDGSYTPPPQTGAWVEVVRISGSTDKTTDAFSITGEKFRLRWTATADNEFGLLYIYVYKVGQSLWLETISISWDAAETLSDSTVVFDNGDVYLEFSAANLSGYEVIVEEYV